MTTLLNIYNCLIERYKNHRLDITMSKISRAMQLNNEGTMFLAKGKEEVAINRYTSALLLIKGGLSEIPVEGHECDSEIALCVSPVLVPSPFSTPDDYFIYNHALVFCQTSASPDTDINFLSSVIIFNMALLYNIQGIRDNAPNFQRRGLYLYEMSLGLLDNFASKNVDSILLRTACLNNMSQISVDQDDFDKAQLLLIHLQYLMSKSFKTSLLDENDIQGFMLNITLFGQPKPARAA